jgi:hypothetical protein
VWVCRGAFGVVCRGAFGDSLFSMWMKFGINHTRIICEYNNGPYFQYR